MILVIAGKEMRLLFASPLAWVVLAFLQLVFSWIFLSRVDRFLVVQGQLASMPNAPGLTEFVVVPVFGVASIVLLMAVPLLTMRLIAEERRNQTMALLMSAPVSMTEIVLGKYLAIVGFLALVSLLIVLMAASLLTGGTLDLGLIAANVIGILLLAASFAAIGVFVSCLTHHPVVAAVLTLAVFLGLWIVNIATSDPQSTLNYVSLLKHFERFLNGSIALSDLIYFAVLIVMFLVLSIRRLDADRLRA